MVSTRHHPRAYPPPEVAVEEAGTATTASNSASKSSASKTSTTTTTNSSSTPASKPRSRAKSKPRVSVAKASTTAASSPGPDSPTSPGAIAATTTTTTTTRTRSAKRVWQHTPSRLILYWLCVSLPLVIWDTGYVLGRPHTMPGGWAHAPIWSPYELYGRVDYIYGWPALEKRIGFTSAQGSLNVIETLLYLAYLYVVRKNGREQDSKAAGARGRRKSASATTTTTAGAAVEGRGAPSRKIVGWLAEARVVSGAPAGAAVLIAFSASIMTLSKTILYWLNEYFSGFDNIGHNSWLDLIFLWIIPNGAWIVLPAWMSYVFGAEILEGLSIASGAPAPKPVAVKDE